MNKGANGTPDFLGSLSLGTQGEPDNTADEMPYSASLVDEPRFRFLASGDE
jgi:hypothetical protein